MLQLIIIFYGPGLWLGHNIWSGSEAGRITATVVPPISNEIITLAEKLLAQEKPNFKQRKKEILEEIEVHGKSLLEQMGLAERTVFDKILMKRERGRTILLFA